MLFWRKIWKYELMALHLPRPAKRCVQCVLGLPQGPPYSRKCPKHLPKKLSKLSFQNRCPSYLSWSAGCTTIDQYINRIAAAVLIRLSHTPSIPHSWTCHQDTWTPPLDTGPQVNFFQLRTIALDSVVPILCPLTWWMSQRTGQHHLRKAELNSRGYPKGSPLAPWCLQILCLKMMNDE